MKRVTGIGGIFFKAKDPVAFAWYQTSFGSQCRGMGRSCILVVRRFRQSDRRHDCLVDQRRWRRVFHRWSGAFHDQLSSRGRARPGSGPARRGCRVLDKIDESEYGIFAWVFDPEGNRVELWQPPAVNSHT
ncbi:MAG: hypothetical protein R3B96_15555 [Pirellulaceae bacterium]